MEHGVVDCGSRLRATMGDAERRRMGDGKLMDFQSLFSVIVVIIEGSKLEPYRQLTTITTTTIEWILITQ